MLNISIDGDYRIISDPHNLILQKRRIVNEGKDAGKETWEKDRYFANLRQVIDAYCKFKVFDSSAETFPELLKLLEEIKETISRLPDINYKMTNRQSEKTGG